MALTPRGRAMRHLSTHRGIIEEPANSNTDRRPHTGDTRFGIRKAQEALGSWLVGLPWCGVWAAWALHHAGVNVTWRLASVHLIQDDAAKHRAPFRDWLPTSEWKRVLRGDLVTWFGLAHVETVRGFKMVDGVRCVITEGGNTSSGDGGSQSNGGGSYRRVRPLSQADGFARVDYPGGARRAVIDRAAMRATTVRHTFTSLPAPPQRAVASAPSDELLLGRLAKRPTLTQPERDLMGALELAGVRA
jgi:hypothetical protein